MEVDAICDGKDPCSFRASWSTSSGPACTPAIALRSIPPRDLREHIEQTIVDYTTRICLELGALGLINIQYVIFQDEVFVLEVNPRSSRTVPFLSKVTEVPMVRLATLAMLGTSLAEMGYAGGLWPKQPLVAVKGAGLQHGEAAGRGDVSGAGDEVDRRGYGCGRHL